MADVFVDNAAGIIVTTNAMTILEAPKTGKRIIRLITLYNPNSTATSFVLDLIVFDESGDERRMRRFDDAMQINDSWVFGMLGAILVLRGSHEATLRQRYEVTLDSTPTNPIEFVIDFADTSA